MPARKDTKGMTVNTLEALRREIAFWRTNGNSSTGIVVQIGLLEGLLEQHEALQFYADRNTWSQSGVAWRTTTDRLPGGGVSIDRKTDRGANARVALRQERS